MANTKITNPELFNLGDSTSATQLPVMTLAQRIAMNAPPTLTVDYLVVAGGAGGGVGGGGAGGYRTSYAGSGSERSGGDSNVENALTLQTETSCTVTVGAGGTGVVGNSTGQPSGSGNVSTFATVTSTGGGGGGTAGYSGWFNAGVSGGSGGGSHNNYAVGATTSAVQGFNGGLGIAEGGGGGGAGGVGGNEPSQDGGIGLYSSITGTSIGRAGGGGGFIAGTASEGGGAGGNPNASDATANTGAGGGGGINGGQGGSGVVILRYATSDVASYTTTGISPTEDTTTIPGQTILSFTTVGTGTITFTALPPAPPPFDGTKVTTPVTDFNKPNTEEGLKLPSGTNANQPSGVQGMIRNDTEITVDSSASAITHYNGTNWQYFAATESSDYPTSLKMYLDASDTTSYPGSGTVWTDLTGNGNNAALTNMTSVNWNSGGYFTLDGSNEYFAIGSNAFQSTTPITACGWVYVSDFTSFRSIFSLRALANQSVKMIVAINTDKTIRLDSASTSNFVILGVSSVANGIPSGQWVHVAAIIDYGTKEYKLYKNKTLAITGTNSSIRNGSDFSVNTFQLGANYNNQYFSGNISKFRVYDKVLSQAEIDALVDEGR